MFPVVHSLLPEELIWLLTVAMLWDAWMYRAQQISIRIVFGQLEIDAKELHVRPVPLRHFNATSIAMPA